jgi:polyferredoxin
MKTWLKYMSLTNTRILSQVVFLLLFLFLIWASWTTRLGGYPVSRLLELDPLVSISTALSTGYVYRYLGWSLGVIVLTFLFGRVFCNWVCPLGSLHQFIGWVSRRRRPQEQMRLNQYRSIHFIKYFVLVVFLIMAALGSLQIGLLDPIVLMYRTFSTVFAPASDMLVNTVEGTAASIQVDSPMLDNLKFGPGVANRVFVGSFWIGLLFLLLLAMNFWYPRFFCRILCPLGALLGILSRFSLFRINRDVGKCTNCQQCLIRCEGASDPQSKVRVSECVSCLNCLEDCPENALSFSFTGLDHQQVIRGPDLSRRRLILAGITGLIAFPLLRNNGLATDENFSPYMIRPPGSVSEPEFMKKCIKCDQCINVCPTNVLQPATLKEGGFETLWTPVMNFNIGHCQLKCNLCSEVCPTGAIRKITVAEKLGKNEYAQQGPIILGTAFINRSRCLPWANEIPCVVCEEVCPVAPKAIQTRDEEVKDVFGKKVVLNKPFVVPDLCIGCGICQTECPVADRPAVYVTAIGESRSQTRRLLLRYRNKTRRSQ